MINYNDIMNEIVKVQPMSTPPAIKAYWKAKANSKKQERKDPLDIQYDMAESWKTRENVNWKTGYQGRENRFLYGAWKVTIEDYKEYMSCFDSFKDKCNEKTLKREEQDYNDFIKSHTDNPTCMLIYYDDLCSAMQSGRKGFMILDVNHKEIADHIIWRS